MQKTNLKSKEKTKVVKIVPNFIQFLLCREKTLMEVTSKTAETLA